MSDTMMADVKAEQRLHRRIATAVVGAPPHVAIRALYRVLGVLQETLECAGEVKDQNPEA